MQRRILRSAAWLVLVAYALTGALFARGLVLCFEADGHVSLEVSRAGEECDACCPNEEPGDESSGEESANWGACACLDVLLGTPDGAQKRSQPRAAVIPPALCVGIVELRSPPAARPLGDSCAALPRSPASWALRRMRGVVLQV